MLTAGAPQPALNSAGPLPEITTRLHAIGALYVIEGSTLGGKFISQMLRQQLNSPSGDIFSFFDGYREQTVNMWEKFKTHIDQLGLTPAEIKVVVEKANEVFSRMELWFGEG